MIHMLDLKADSCRWPLWPDGEIPSHQFCGAVADSGSYCAEHTIRAKRTAPALPEQSRPAWTEKVLR